MYGCNIYNYLTLWSEKVGDKQATFHNLNSEFRYTVGYW